VLSGSQKLALDSAMWRIRDLGHMSLAQSSSVLVAVAGHFLTHLAVVQARSISPIQIAGFAWSGIGFSDLELNGATPHELFSTRAS